MLTIERVQGALEGFFVRFGHWPVRLVVEPPIHESHVRYAFDGNYSKRDRELLVALALRISIASRNGADYVAEDDSGNSYDYGNQGFPEGIESGMLLRAWLARQTPA